MQTAENENQERMPTSPLPTIEPLPYSSESDLTGVPMTASMTPNEPQGSSSEEPSWGRTRQKSSKELADDWQTWETTNTRKTPERDASGWEAWSTPKYRHDRCNMCHKPVTIAWVENDTVFLCLECTPTVIKGDTVGESTNTKGDGRRERDDEEEWGRIPIPQSDDSYSTEGWLTDESDQDETNSTANNNKLKDKAQEYRNCVVAYLLAPRKDGRILTKDGNIIDVNEQRTSTSTMNYLV
jgi:hypothetical protein